MTAVFNRVSPVSAATRASHILDAWLELTHELIEMGDLRGAEVMSLYEPHLRERARALKDAVCNTCFGFRIPAKAEYRCTCPPKGKK